MLRTAEYFEYPPDIAAGFGVGRYAEITVDHAFAGVENSSLILARSFETAAVPVSETYFWEEASAKERLMEGLRAISSSLCRRASVSR